MKNRIFLIAVALALASVFGCAATQPTQNPGGGQTASPTGKAVLQTADDAAGVAQPLLEKAQKSADPFIAILGTLGGAAVLWGLKRLHDKLDDITPETPVVTTVPPK